MLRFARNDNLLLPVTEGLRAARDLVDFELSPAKVKRLCEAAQIDYDSSGGANGLQGNA